MGQGAVLMHVVPHCRHHASIAPLLSHCFVCCSASQHTFSCLETRREPQSRLELSQVTCFTSTKVQILTPEELRARILPRRPRSHLLLPPLVLLRRTHSPLTTARSSHTVRTRGYSSTRATHVPLAPLRGRCAAPGVALRSVAQSHAASVLGVRAQ